MPVYIITDMNGFRTVLNNEERLVFIDFSAAWCGPCRMIYPFIESLAESELSQSVAFYKVDVDVAADVAEYCDISSMPTFIAYQNGEKVAQLTGANKTQIVNLLSQLTGLQLSLS
jgi:thioredoxin 1